MSSKIHVALLNDIFCRGGVERILSYQSNALFSESGGVIFLFDNSRIDFTYTGSIVPLDINPPPYSNIFAETYFLIKGIFALRAAKKKHNIHVCISHKEGPNFINILTGLSKVVVTVHEFKSRGIKYRGWKKNLVKFMIKVLYNRSDQIVAVSHGIALDLIENFKIRPEKICTIYNPCDVKLVKKLANEVVSSPNDQIFQGRVILTVGRLERQKGHWHLIRAFGKIANVIDDVQLIIIGEGDDLKYLQSLAADIEIEGRVHFLGFKTNPFKYMARSTMFVLSSLWEGFPGVLMEAMACGLPILSTDCLSGPRELLSRDPENTRVKILSEEVGLELADFGILIPKLDGEYRSAQAPLSNEEALLATAMKKILEDDGLRSHYSEQGYRRADEMDMETFSEKWRAVILRAGA